MPLNKIDKKPYCYDKTIDDLPYEKTFYFLPCLCLSGILRR